MTADMGKLLHFPRPKQESTRSEPTFTTIYTIDEELANLELTLLPHLRWKHYRQVHKAIGAYRKMEDIIRRGWRQKRGLRMYDKIENALEKLKVYAHDDQSERCMLAYTHVHNIHQRAGKRLFVIESALAQDEENKD